MKTLEIVNFLKSLFNSGRAVHQSGERRLSEREEQCIESFPFYQQDFKGPKPAETIHFSSWPVCLVREPL